MYWRTYSLTHWHVHGPAEPLTQIFYAYVLPTDGHGAKPACWLVARLIDLMVAQLIDAQIDRQDDWQTNLTTEWQTRWLTDGLTDKQAYKETDQDYYKWVFTAFHILLGTFARRSLLPINQTDHW